MSTATFALIFGIAYLGAGLLGLIPAALTPAAGRRAAHPLHRMLYGHLLGLFPVNVLAYQVYLALGSWGIAAWLVHVRTRQRRARSLAIFYGALAGTGTIPGMSTLFGMLPIHGHDVWLHAGTAAVVGALRWRSAVTQMERRQYTEPRGAPLRCRNGASAARPRRSPPAGLLRRLGALAIPGGKRGDFPPGGMMRP